MLSIQYPGQLGQLRVADALRVRVIVFRCSTCFLDGAEYYGRRNRTRIYQYLHRILLPGTLKNIPFCLNDLLVNFREQSSHLCCTTHKNRNKNCRFYAQSYDWKHLYLSIFSCTDIPSFCHNSSYTSDPKMHHSAMDSWVLSLQQCGKATAVFVRSKHHDIVAEV